MIYEVVVASDPMRFAHFTMHVDAGHLIEAIQVAEKQVEEETGAPPGNVFAVSAKETEITRIINARSKSTCPTP